MNLRFQHDCGACVPLGTVSEHDLYFCPQGFLPTVIARYGASGPEYLSGLEVARSVRAELDWGHPLAQALTLAEKAGHLKRLPGVEFNGAHQHVVIRLDSVLLEHKLRPVRGLTKEVRETFVNQMRRSIEGRFLFEKMDATLRAAIDGEVERWIRVGIPDLFAPE